ncbi:MAG TPA: sensor histidine kinase [Lachnospiraceae bacterium]|nr:sensor histidine kinase [Lachnospiraceae bacterium]
MNSLVHKIILILCCICFSVILNDSFDIVFPLLLVIIISSLTGYFSNRILSTFLFVFYLILCCFFPLLIFFLPIVCYDIFLEKLQFIFGLSCIPFLVQYQYLNGLNLAVILVLCMLSYILKHNYYNLKQFQNNYIKLRDETAEMANSLSKKNKELLEKQDYEVNLATLNERNRIAREIHDNIGHMLSRSILQVGALLAITKDETTKEALEDIKTALTSGMDSIRNSIHNIHEDSIDLKTKLEAIVHEFTFCSISFSYYVANDFTIKAKYSILYIVKEALNNVIKHSNATKVSISIDEHQNLYQIIISDNGTKKPEQGSSGSMGINSMQERIASLNGTIHIDKDMGFRIFISLPKENKP